MSDQSPFDPPSGPSGSMPFGAPAGPPTEPMPVSPIAPKSSPWKPAALGFGAAAVLGAGVFGIVQLTGDDDEPPAVATASIPVPSIPGDLDEQIDEQIDAVNEQIDDVLSSLPVTIPDVPGGPTDSAAPSASLPDADADADTDGDEPTTITMPELGDLGDLGDLGAITECLGLGDLLGGIDLDELGDLGTLPAGSIPNFEELTPEELAALDVDELLEQIFGEMATELPGGSLPFDPSIIEQLDLGELGDVGALDPEQLQELIESQLGALGSLPEMPPMSIPTGSLPFDPAELEECLGDLAP